MADNSHKGEASVIHEEHDHEIYAKKITSRIAGNVVVYEDTNFTSADSPAILDVFNDLGRIATTGHLHNTSLGDLQVEVSFDGVNYGGIYTLSGGQVINFDNETIKKVRITFVDPTSYLARFG